MTYGTVIAAVIVSVILPFAVNLIKNKAVSSNAASWLAIAISAACGLGTAFASGMPSSPEEVLAAVFAVIGGVQVAYRLFKSVGVTNKWLDNLEGIGSKTDSEAVESK